MAILSYKKEALGQQREYKSKLQARRKKMRLDKRKTGILLFIIICLLIYTGWYSQSLAKQPDNEHEGIIRFHVLANSNTAEDQELKLKVRDGVLQAVNEELVRETMAQYDEAQGDVQKIELDAGYSREYIEENLEEIERIAEKIVEDNGYDYPVEAKLGVRWIPEKTYGDATFPAGNYEALNIVIGQGEGQNWWCVLFPPLCLIDSTSDVEMKGAEDFRLEVGTAPAIQLKFKTLELLNKAK